MFVLQPIGARDVDAASELHRAVFTAMGERGWTGQEIADLLGSSGVRGWLLQYEGQSVGFALSRVAADEAELLTIAVDVAHRRQGAGRRMLEPIIEHAKSCGARSLFLEVGADNPAARALYEQAGFEEVGRRAAYYERGQGVRADALVLRLRLDG